MELCQRTGQLAIVSVMGRGTQVTDNLLPRYGSVNHSQSYQAKGVASVVGCQLSVAEKQRTEGGGQRAEVGDQR